MTAKGVYPQHVVPQKAGNRTLLFMTAAVALGAVLLLLLFLVVYQFRIKPEDRLEYVEIQHCLTTPPKKSLRDLFAKLEEYSTSEKISEIEKSSYLKKGGEVAVRNFLEEERGEYGRWAAVIVNPASNLKEVDPTKVRDVFVVYADEGVGSGAWGGGHSAVRHWYLLVGSGDEILGWIAADR
ncbi:MAG: hypothetical protein IT461_02585 [Planctomycetes bacterium]|nr:hypothetical protein [Planctomycetota bacterium]